MRVGSSCKVPFVIVRFYSNLFSLQISEKKIIEIPNFMNICLVGAALFHADRQTLRVTFRNFANVPKNEKGKIKKYLEECT